MITSRPFSFSGITFKLEPKILAWMALFFFVLLTYCHQKDFDSPTPASRLCLLYEVCEHGRLEIGHSIRHTPDVAEINGKFYSDKAPGMAVAALPGFALGWFLSGWVGAGNDARLLAASWLGCALSAALVLAIGAALLCDLLAQFVQPKWAFLTVLTLVFGAAPFPYATMMHSHALVVGLICVSLWVVCRQKGEINESGRLMKIPSERRVRARGLQDFLGIRALCRPRLPSPGGFFNRLIMKARRGNSTPSPASAVAGPWPANTPPD